MAALICPNCGAKRPDPAQPDTWDCACGQKGITGNFCPNCGKKRGEEIWQRCNVRSAAAS